MNPDIETSSAGLHPIIQVKVLKKRARPSVRNIPKKPEQTVEKCRNKNLDLDDQWDRYAARLKEAIEASHRAANHHIKATTQLDAAEFAACELFKEYPGARNCLNPVIYAEFPALKNHEASGRSEGERRIPAIA